MNSHQIFLSHSGQQKLMTEYLYYELKRANYSRVFFDQDTTDSLPKASELQQTILGAIERCELGVVVISEAFITSYWPMLELQHLVAASPIGPSKPASEKKKIYPIFFGLEPSDLTKPENLARWKGRWHEMALKKQDNTDDPISGCCPFEICANLWPMVVRGAKGLTSLNSEEEPELIRTWTEALKELKSRAGSIIPKDISYGCWRSLTDGIISKICEILPPTLLYDEALIQGKEGTAKIIEDRFTKIPKNNNSVSNTLVLGIYGLGGGGKTTLCKTMTDFYNQHGFCGKSVWLELPTNEDKGTLKDKLKSAIIKLTGANDKIIKGIESLEEVISTFKSRIQDCQFFLAIDNVWPWSKDYVSDLLTAATKTTCNENNKIIITGRSQELLTKLFKGIGPHLEGYWVVDNIPDITKEDALKTLLAYSGCLWLRESNIELYKQVEHNVLAIVDVCFFHNHYHPLVLRAMGRMLAQVDYMENLNAWKGLANQVKDAGMRLKQQISDKKVDDDEVHTILIETLKLNYDLLNKDLQNIFLDVAILWTYRSNITNLCFLHLEKNIETMKMKILRIENFGLWSVRGSASSGRIVDVEIHDLYKLLAQKEAASRGNYLVVPHGVRSSSPGVRPSSGGRSVTRLVIQGHLPVVDDGLEQIMREICYDRLQLLEIEEVQQLDDWLGRPLSIINEVWNLAHRMGEALHILRLELAVPKGINIIDGLSSAPNLRKLSLDFHSSTPNLKEIKGIECLTKLQDFQLSSYPGGLPLNVPNLSGCSSLKTLKFSSTNLTSLAQLHLASHLLEKLDLSCNPNLVDINGDSNILGSMQALKTLRISECKNIKEFPNVSLNSLKILDMRDCQGLELMMPGASALSDQLPALEELYFAGCNPLKAFPPIGTTNRFRILSGQQDLYLHLCHQNTSKLVRQLQDLEKLSITGLQKKHFSDDLETSLSKLEMLEIRIQGSSKPEVKDIMKNSSSLSFFSTWSLPSLTSVELEGFFSVESLRELSPHTSRIQKLSLREFQSLKSVNMSSLWTTLASLELHKCPALKILELDSSRLPNFQSLKLEDCQSLKTLTDLPSSLRNLNISGDCSISLENLQQCLLPLKKLASLTYEAPKSEPQEYSKLDLSCLLNLHNLRLCSCSSLESLDDIAGLTSLFDIWLEDCSSLRSLPSLSRLTSLSQLHLVRCSSLQEIPDLSSNTRLKLLYLRGCSSLQEIPDLSSNTRLYCLQLIGCRSLKRLPRLPEVNHKLTVILSTSQMERMETLSSDVLSIRKLPFVHILIF